MPPLLLVANEHGSRVVAQRCQRAAAYGVQCGDSLAMSRSRCGEQAEEVPFDLLADAKALSHFACWCLRYGPRAAVEASPGTAAVCVQITGCQHVHGGWVQLLSRVRRDLARLHLHGSAAVAGNTAAALVAAEHASWCVMEQDPASWLLDAPLAMLRVQPAVVQALHEMGVRTIGQLKALPAGGLADRFGQAPWQRLRLAMGEQPEQLHSVVPYGPLRVQWQLDGPTSQVEAVQQIVQQLLERLSLRLLRRRMGTRHLRVVLHRAASAATSIDLRLTRTSRRAEHMWRLLQPHMERVHCGMDPSQGIELVQVCSLQHGAMGLGQWIWAQGRMALEDEGDPGWAEWLDQIRKRLGPCSVRRAHGRVDPNDELAWAWRVAEGEAPPCDLSEVPGDTRSVARPLVRLAPPQPVRVECDARRRPIQLWVHGAWRLVTEQDGPERVTAAWWRGERGTQDRWRVRADGTWWWLRREDRLWFLDGAWT